MNGTSPALALRCRDLTCGYGSRAVLSGVDLDLRPGEVCGVMGANGSGKSTLVRHLCLERRPWAGEVEVLGRPIRAMTPRDVAQVMAVVPQQAAVSFPFTAFELTLMGRKPFWGAFGRESRADLDLAQEALELVGLAHKSDAPVTELSAGERQLVWIARALAQTPRLVLLDEATANLDVNHAVAVMNLLVARARREGLAVLAIIHDLNLAAAFCERLVFLAGGRVLADGPLERVLDEENIWRAFGARVKVDRDEELGRVRVAVRPEQHRHYRR
jgi:iron complex transport system ATP-binding protein